MNHMAARTDHGLQALAWLSGGAVMASLFTATQLPPLRMTILLLAGASVAAIASLRTTELSVVSRLFVLLYCLPFTAMVGYLFDRDFVWWNTPGNILLCQNHRLIDEMLVMVLVGLCGLMLGLEFVTMKVRRPVPSLEGKDATPPKCTLPLPACWFLLLVSLVLSWLHAPQKNIFVAGYASADSGAGMDVDAGLNASCLVSYAILVLLFVDAEQEPLGSRRQWQKLGACFLVTGYIVLVLQLLRGDRECAGLVAALVMLYITSPATATIRARIRQRMAQTGRLFKLMVPLAGGVVAFVALGSLRHSASQAQSESFNVLQVISEGATENTWTAVALCNLGVAADYHYGSIEYLYGQSYADYFLSLPPGVITKSLGYDRPMDGGANPAAWYHNIVTAGGMHPAVVPFKNFGIWGVFGIMFLCGVFIGSCELANERGTFGRRLLAGCLTAGSMLWFWYGDMSLIRSLMCWLILALMHRLLATSTRPAFPQFAPARRALHPPRLAAMR